MKIVHVYSGNLEIFEESLKGTGCCLNGSKDVKYLTRSFPNYNVRDVLGLVVFQRHLTRRTLGLIKTFDEYFVFNPRPIIVICDEAFALFEAKKLMVKHSPLFLIDSMEGTISDVDLQRIFTTLVCMSGDMYDLKSVEQLHGLGGAGKKIAAVVSSPDATELNISHLETLVATQDILQQLQDLGVCENASDRTVSVVGCT